MTTINLKAIVIAVFSSIVAQIAAVLAEKHFGWDPTHTAAVLMSFVVVWYVGEMDDARAEVKDLQARIATALDKLERATRR